MNLFKRKKLVKYVRPFKPFDPRKTSKYEGIAVKCCECLEGGFASWHGINLVPQYYWRKFRVGLKTYYICPKCQAKRREWAKQFYTPLPMPAPKTRKFKF